jgi:hypothetical protein
MPLPGAIAAFIWILIVLGAKFFLPKLYVPYAVVFFGALI